MACTINADDGVISGSAGVKTTADTTGALNIQTNGTTAISISSAQVVSFPSTTSIGTLYFGAGTVTAPSISTTGDSNTGIYFPAADTIAFTEGGVEAMRITSAGDVGIGTTSPSEKLEVAGAVKLTAGNLSVAPSTATNAAVTICSNTGGTFFAGLDSSTGSSFGVGNYSSVLYNGANTPMVFFTNATERMRLSSGGNLGIGTASPGQKLEVAGNILINTSGNPYMEVKTSGAGNNPYLKLTADTNNWIVQGTFSNTNDELMFQYNSSTLMTLDKNGNLGVGTSSVFDSNTRLELSKSGNCQQFISSTDSSGVRIYLSAFTSTAGNIGTFSNHPLLLRTNDAERVRITAGGLVGIGNSSPSNSQAVITGLSTYTANTYFALRLNAGSYSDSGSYTTMLGFGVENAGWSKGAIGYTRTGGYDTGYLAFYVNGSVNPDMVALADEKVRITSAGNVLIGKTDTSYDVNGIALLPAQARLTADSGNPLLILRNGTNGSVADFWKGGIGIVGSISITTSATSYNTSSDRRLKENVLAADDAGSVVDSIQVVKHDWKVGGHVRYGVIAQDLHKIAPEAVTVGDSEEVEKLETPWSVDYSKLVPMLVKELQSVRARLAALEGNN